MKKFLIISSYAPPAVSGGPITMYQILRHFQKDSFVILTSHNGIGNKEIDRGLKLQAKYFFFDTPAMTSHSGFKREESGLQRIKIFIKNFTVIYKFYKFLSLFLMIGMIIKRGVRIIREENIEFIFCYSDHGPSLVATYFLHLITKKPYTVYFYDIYYKNKFPWNYSLLAFLIEPKLFKSAKKIFVLNGAIAKHYEKEYGRETFVIPNAVTFRKNEKRPPLPKSHPEPFRIIFTGTVDWPQNHAIQNLIKAISSIKMPRVELLLYTPHDEKFLAAQGIFPSRDVIFNYGMPQEMPKIQTSADILFVGLSFRTDYPLIINTSSPTKTWEYMTSGRPLLIHAPSDSYLVKYAKKYNFGYTVDTDNIDVLREAIFKLINDRSLVASLTTNAWERVYKFHNAEIIAQDFKKLLAV